MKNGTEFKYLVEFAIVIICDDCYVGEGGSSLFYQETSRVG